MQVEYKLVHRSNPVEAIASWYVAMPNRFMIWVYTVFISREYFSMLRAIDFEYFGQFHNRPLRYSSASYSLSTTHSAISYEAG